MPNRVAAIERAPEWASLFRDAPVAIAVTEGPDDRYVYVNAEFLRIAGRAADHFLGRTVADAAVGEDAKGFAAAARRIRETKAGLTRLAIPTRIDRADGLAEVFLDVQIEPLRTADARVGGVLLVVVDATARVHAERRAASLEVAQNAVLEQMPNAVLLVDRKGSFVMGNLAARRLAGDADLGRLTLAGLQATFDIRTPDRIPIGPDRSPLVRALRGEEVPAAEYVVRRPSDGSELWINYAAAPLRDAQGTITGAFGVIADMTTEHRLRETIAASEERLRRVYEAVGCGLLVRDKDGTIVFANQEAASIFGVSAELLIGTAGATGVQRYTEDGRLMPPDAVPSATAMREVRALRDVRSRLVRSDGTVSWVRIDAVPVPSRDGSIDYVVTSFVDITERYRAEQRLALRARQQAAVAELGRIALAADDLQSLFDETVRTVNGLLGAEACRIIEHDPAERRLTVRAGQRLGGESSGTWIPDGPTDSQAGYTIAQGTDVIANDLATETRFKVYRPILDAGFRSTVTTIISGHDRPFGMVAAISRDTVFAPDDVMFLRAVANVLGEAIERLSAIERLRTNEARLRTVVENLPLELMVYDAAGRVTLTSGRRLAGRQSVPPAVGDSIYEVNKRNPDGLNRIVRALRGEEVHEEVRSGDQVLDMRHHPVIGPGGNVTEVVGLALDVTERSRAQAELSRKEAFVRAIFDSVQTHLAVLDRSGVIVDANQHWLSYVRSGEADLKDATIGDDYLAFLRSNGGDEGREAAAGIEAVLEGKRPSFAMEFPLERANVRRWFQLSVEPLRAADGGVVLGHQDVTERKRVEEALEHQALHDNVTDLPNRTLLRDRLRQAILAARRRNTQVALLFIDLDRFKELNDTFGHQAGDVVLREVGERFVDAVRASDTVARLGGDEFAVLIPLATDRDEAVMVARRVLASLQEPFVMEGESAFIEASIGVVLCPEHGEDVQTLMRRADVAMYQAKRAGSGLQLYEAEKDLHSPGAIGLAGDLRHSIERGELLLHFQPIVDLAAGRCVGVEALCRWEHPTRGLIPPGTFIPLAEENGFIRHIGLWTMQEAMQLISGPNGALVPVMSVNLSMRNLRATDLAATFAEMLERTGADPTRLKVEITETAMMADAEHTLAVLGDIQRMGIRLSIDDFGTGYSSLAYLQRLPVDDIKVDRSFVLNMLKNSGDAAIVRSTIELAHSLGLRAIAEGVEDQPTLNRLRELRCDRAQGFYIGRPMPMAQLVGWLTTSPWRTVP